MGTLSIKINQVSYQIEEDQADVPLLWVLREQLNLTGTKFGCGLGQCGACMVLLNSQPTFACLIPTKSCVGKEITTIEGIKNDEKLHPVQQAWIDEQVPQCGYCQSGQIISAVALLDKNPTPNDADIDLALAGNLCRCGTYPRIKKAIKRASKAINHG